MRMVRYKTHWAYTGPAISRREPLSAFILDIMYLMEMHGVIPPLEVLNEILEKGGNNGGMGPGTTWRSFTITDDEYDELVGALLTADMLRIKQNHPYVRFESIIVDYELREIKDYRSWLKASFDKYGNNK